MPADQADVEAVHSLVLDATQFLDWCAGSESLLSDDDERFPVLGGELREAYRAALEQAEEYFSLALRTLRGENPEFPLTEVLDAIELAGWTGALRDFKLQVLERSGRTEVMEVAKEGRVGGGVIRRFVFGRFKSALNAALDSLTEVPGVGLIKELKDFVSGGAGV